MERIDINCDLGEGCSHDQELIPCISSANIACGFHAGDKDTLKRTLELCKASGVAVGAHPSYPDREGFGRIDMLGNPLTLSDVKEILAEQLSIFRSACDALGLLMHHVKPHGALYNRAARDPELSALICECMQLFHPGTRLYGLSGSETEKAALAYQIHFCREGFADRNYQPDGTLIPRNEPDALISVADRAVSQVLKMVRDHKVDTRSGTSIQVRVDTVCIHGDGPHAVEFARAIQEALKKEGIFMVSPGNQPE